MGTQVEIGAIGWQHESWQQDYYPDELPEDWLLSYYANEYRCVLVPHDTWFDAEQEVITKWYEDVHDKFRFAVELIVGAGSELDASVIADRLRPLGDRLTGIVVRPQTDCEITGEKFTGFLRQLALELAVYVDMSETGSGKELADFFRELGGRVCWQEDITEEIRGACMGIISSDSINGDLRLMRKQVQKFMDQLDDCEDACLFIGGAQPSVQLMSESTVLLSLLSA